MKYFDSNYYNNVLNENGYEDMRDEVKPIDFSLGNLSSEELSLSWFCHHDCEKFASIANSTREKVKVITGIGLSGVPHLGTLSQMLKSIKLQQEGGLSVKFVLGDLDAYNGKGTPLEKTKFLADKVRNFMLDIGFDDSGRNELNSQYEELDILRTMYLTSYFMDDGEFNNAEEDLHSFYADQGKVDNQMSFRRKLSLALMVGGWYHQQLENGEKNILVTLGIDEHKYVKFGQNTLSRMQKSDLFKDKLEDSSISAMYSTLIRGFNNYPKMSKSFPDSGITLDMPKEKISNLIHLGEGNHGLPEDNVVLQCVCNASTFTREEIEEAFEAYQKGGAEWNKIKSLYVDNLWSLLKKWQNTN